MDDIYNTINDCYVDVYGVKLTEEAFKRTYELLPKEIKSLATQWGWNDTEVGDKICRWLRDKSSIL